MTVDHGLGCDSRRTHGVPNKPMVATATTQLASNSPDSGRRHIGRPLGSAVRIDDRRVCNLGKVERRNEKTTMGCWRSMTDASAPEPRTGV